MSDRYLIVDDASARVVDIAMGEPAELSPGHTSYLAPNEQAGIGWRRDAADGTFSDVPAPGPAPVTVVAKVEFYRRCTEAEAVAIDAAFQAQPLRLRRIFDAAVNFRSDAEEWPLLLGAATQLFGAARAAQLLAAT